MATNGNNSGGGQISYSSNGTPNMGISGNLQNRMAGNAYSERFYREDSGYLDSTKGQLEQMLKYYNEIASLTKDLSKVEQNRFNKQQKALEEQLKMLQYVQETRSVDFEESIKLIRESNKLLISGQKAYKDVLESTQDAQSDADKEHLGNLEEAINYMNKIKDIADDTNKDMKDTAKTLNNTSADLGKSLSNTLKSAANTTKEIANMLNLQSLANPESAAKDRLAARNAVMKQLGMTSDSQYSQFNKSLVNELQTMNSQMGNLFSADDMYAYFEKMSELGITNQKMAEEQMRATVIGSKYLGVSGETQQAIFKFMRTTNDYTMLDKHNKTIAGLLKSQLGVSKEQLDIMSKTVYSDADVLAALGGNAKKYTSQALAAGAAVDSVMGVSGMGDVLTKTLGQIVTAAPQDLGKWAQIFGSDVQAIRRYGQAGEAGKAIELMINNNQLKNISGMNSDAIAGLMSELGIDAGLININRYFKENGTASYNEKLATSLANIESMTDNELARYLEDTTELTWLEKLSNTSSLMLEEMLGYKGTMKLANAALIMYLGSGIVDMITNFKSLNLMSLLTTQLGAGSTMGKHAASTAGLATGAGTGGKALAALGMGAAVIGLTAGTIAALGSYFAGKQDEAYKNQYAENMESLKGTSLADNASMASAMTVASASNSMTGFGTDMGNTKSGISYGFAKLTTKDKDSLNKALTEWMYRAGVFTDPNYVLAWAYLMNQVDSLDAMNQAMGTDFSSASLYKIVSDKNFDNQSAWNHMASILKAGWHPYTDNNGGRIKDWQQAAEIWDMNKYDGYHMAGKYYIPKDNYKALLHKGEMVLNAREATALRTGIEKNVGGQSDTLYKNQQKIILGKTVPSKTDVGYAGAEMGLPSGWTLTSAYGTYTGIYDSTGKIKKHRGLDFAAATGTPIRAAHGGTIYFSSSEGGYGNTIRIHDKATGFYNRYGHLSRFANIKNGATVNRGDLIGYVGNTGNSTGPHLHFQVNKTNNESDDINPWPYITLDMFGGSGSLGLGDATSSASSSSGLVSAAASPSTRRFIPGASVARNSEKNVGGSDTGATRIVSSVDGGFNKLISYLESISKKQDEQQMLLDAFSKSRTSGPDF